MTSLPNLPRADLRRIALHWTGDDYRTTFSAYHFCIALGDDDRPFVVATHDVRANARDVGASDAPYAAHTRGRNSYTIGVAVCGMRGAVPHDFDAHPLRDDMMEATCALVAHLARAYAIDVGAETIATHAEAAVDDGYFGCGDEQRWDIARLVPEARPLEANDARATGDVLRERIARA